MSSMGQKREDCKKVFAKNLRRMIDKENLTLEAFADRTDLTVRGVNYYLEGKRLPEAHILSEIASYSLFRDPCRNLCTARQL